MRVPTTHRDRQALDVSMTPMIDVVFQLLIFFICTVSFQAAENLLPTSLAATSGARVTIPTEIEPILERIVVRGARLADRTEWTVNQRLCRSFSEVRQVLADVAQIDRTLPVVLDVGDAVPLGDMIDVYDLSRLVGFEKIQFAATK